ncbi:Hypothetical predicted protein, partial [Pelobates cultripes]
MATAGKSPISSAPSDSSMEGANLRTLLTQLPSKTDLKVMFSKMEKSFGEKLQTFRKE